ncbi:MAG: YHS domain-containing (seleno)protein [Defluviicoccus sp.]
MPRRVLLLFVCCVALLGVAAIAGAQTLSDTNLRLVLTGYDPVAYFTEGQPTPGKPEFETVFDGARYRFASAANMNRFQSDPDKYAPQFAGACTHGLSKGVKVAADPNFWRIIDGKLYVFASSKALPEMDSNPQAMQAIIANANENNTALAGQPFKSN